MKLNCNIEVCHRLSVETAKRKQQRSCLAIGKKNAKDQDFHLLLQTQTNQTGTKYKILGNIEQIFAKYLEEGKATIRLKEPPLDLAIKSDAIQLKSFLHVLKLALTNKLDSANLKLSDLSAASAKKMPAPLKTKIVIKSASEYPTLKGFPRTTEELHLVELGRRSFDRQILKLQNLRVLNLSHNNLTNLPNELGTLPNLQELHLSHNKLGLGPVSKWSWLTGTHAKNKLRLLNLSSNQMTYLPDQIKNLLSLYTLNVNDNSISCLPQGIGKLKNLKFLLVSNNKIRLLPGSFRNLRLENLDLSGNNCEQNENDLSDCQLKVPRLVELAGQIVLKTRRHYDSSTIPYTLVDYLDKANYCMCGLACFESYIRKLMNANLRSFAASFVLSMAEQNLKLDCYFCSVKCVRRFYRNF